MQVRTQHGLVNIGNKQRPAIRIAILPKQSSGYLLAGIGIGIVMGFALGSVATLLVGEKSLALAQQLWNRLSGVSENEDRVHFELLLQ